MTSRRARIVEPELDALDIVTREDLGKTADAVSQVLEDLSSVLTDDSQVLIYKIGANTNGKSGGWDYIKTLTPPINTDMLLDELREEWGGGNYVIRVRANKKIVTTKQISIGGESRIPKSAKADNDQSLLPLLMRQMDASKSDTMQMMTMMMTTQQAAAQQQAQMMQASATQQMQMLMTMLPLLANKGESTSSMLAAFAQMQSALGGGSSKLTETIETMTALKGLFGDGGNAEGGSDDFITSAGKALLPLLAKGMGEASPPPSGLLPAPPPRPIQTLPPVGPPPATPTYVPPKAQPDWMKAYGAAPAMPTVTPKYSHRLIGLLAEDLKYLAMRKIPAHDAARILLNVLQNNQVGQDEIVSLALHFQASADWIADLSAQGIDLRGDPQWANATLSELIRQYSNAPQ